MKKFLLTLAAMLVFLSAQAADITPISNAFKGGNASSLTALMDTEVDMALPENSRKCNAQDAVALLNQFFGSNKPSDFTVLHHADKNDSGFFVGKLPTSSKEYRVNITYKTDNGKTIIQSIRIE